MKMNSDTLKVPSFDFIFCIFFILYFLLSSFILNFLTNTQIVMNLLYFFFSFPLGSVYCVQFFFFFSYDTTLIFFLRSFWEPLLHYFHFLKTKWRYWRNFVGTHRELLPSPDLLLLFFFSNKIFVYKISFCFNLIDENEECLYMRHEIGQESRM